MQDGTKERDECQICGGTQAIDAAGRVWRHGYKRPGWGWLVGGCRGTGHAPFPATDALEREIDLVEKYRADRLEAQAVAHAGGAPVALTIGSGYVGRKFTRTTHTVRSAAEAFEYAKAAEGDIRRSLGFSHRDLTIAVDYATDEALRARTTWTDPDDASRETLARFWAEQQELRAREIGREIKAADDALTFYRERLDRARAILAEA